MDRTFCVAPMMGRTDTHFRNLCRFASKHAVLFTEMVHSNALVKNKRIDKYILKTDIENPVVFQLGGCEPKDLAEATKIINENKYDEINLNVGCPSPRVKSGGFGAFLMYEPTKVKDCLTAMTASSDIPITAKIRLGVDNQDIEETLDYFIEIILQSGIKTIYVHARKGMLDGLNPKENRNIPPLNYERVYRLKEDFPDIEIILNGGLSNFQRDKDRLKMVDGLMYGRYICEKPYELTKVDKIFYQSTNETEIETLIMMMEKYLIKNQDLGFSGYLVKRHMVNFFKGFSYSKKIRQIIMSDNLNIDEIINILKKKDLLVA